MRMKGKSGRGSKGKGSGASHGPSGGQRELNVRLKTARSRTPSSQRWLERQLNDPYVSASKRAGYRSRAAFKLIEIDDKYRFLKPGHRIVDLGAAPGGWSQIAAERLRVADRGLREGILATLMSEDGVYRAGRRRRRQRSG